MSEEIHLNDIGTEFRVTLADSGETLDISSATVKQLIFQKPDCSKVTKDVSFYTDGTDGILTYTSVDGDLDVDGQWRLQAYVELSSGKFKSQIVSFRVFNNL